MIRRRFLAGLAAAVLGVIASGCETLRHGGTRNNSVVDEDEEEMPKEARNQHKSTRLPGAMSSEGSDIERNLGVR